MRPIDADALSGRMYHDAFETDSDMQKWDSGCWIRFKMFENAIAEAPTITPERKRGKWTDQTTCSECGWQMIDDILESPNIVGFNFCPNCGAEMQI